MRKYGLRGFSSFRLTVLKTNAGGVEGYLVLAAGVCFGDGLASQTNLAG